MNKPKKMSKVNENIEFAYNDNSVKQIEIKMLRDLCPCATCQGETILFTTYKPEPIPDKPGKYILKNVSMVGNYAFQIFWEDGHDTGIYSWEYLDKIIQK